MIKISGFADEINENLEEQIRVLGKLGMSWIECRGVNGKPLISYSLKEAEGIRTRLDQAGIYLSSMGTSIGKIMITEDFAPHFELFRHTVELADVMGTRNIRMFSFFIPEGQNPEQYEDEVMRRLDALAEYAVKKDVVLLHENEKEIYGDIAPRCLKIMERFYSDHFKAVFDFANFVQCGQDTMEAWEMLKPYVDYIHVKDALMKDGTVVPAGSGDGHVKEILQALKAGGYEGFLSLEPHLADFAGFEALEHGVAKAKKLTGEEAFTLAYDSLQKILTELEWK